MKKNKGKKTGFFGEHTEKIFWLHLINDKKLITNRLKEFLSKGEIMYRFSCEKEEYDALAFPTEGPVQALNVIKKRGEEFQFSTCVPLLKGSNFSTSVRDSYTWKNPVLGEFSADIEG